MASTSGIQPARPRPAPKRPQVSRRSFLRRAWLTERQLLASTITHTAVDVVWSLWFK